jgi:hypothetical protein
MFYLSHIAEEFFSLILKRNCNYHFKFSVKKNETLEVLENLQMCFNIEELS